MFGCFQVALGLTLFFLGSRLLPSGQAALISTLETPLMPFWIWVGFAEVPTLRVLVGGALVMGAVIADIIGDSRTQRPVRLIRPNDLPSSGQPPIYREKATISTQFGFLPIGYSLSLVSLPVALSIA